MLLLKECSHTSAFSTAVKNARGTTQSLIFEPEPLPRDNRQLVWKIGKRSSSLRHFLPRLLQRLHQLLPVQLGLVCVCLSKRSHGIIKPR